MEINREKEKKAYFLGGWFLGVESAFH